MSDAYEILSPPLSGAPEYIRRGNTTEFTIQIKFTDAINVGRVRDSISAFRLVTQIYKRCGDPYCMH